MKSAVVYYTQSGNTEKVARTIACAIEAECVAPIAETPDLDAYDLVFVGMPVEQFGAPEVVRQFLAERCAGRRIALFATHAAPDDLTQLEPWLVNCRKAAEGAELVGFFHCQGALAEPVRQAMLASDTPMLQQFAQMAGCADGQPDEAALARAADFARKTVVPVGREPASAPEVALV